MKKLTRRELLSGLAGGVLAGAAAPEIARFGAYQTEFAEHDLALPRWDADGFRLGVLTDLHLNGPAQVDRAIGGLRSLFAAKPDAIVLGGDYIERKQLRYEIGLARLAETFGEATCPVFAVMGNHDYWSRAPQWVVDAFRGIRLLRNEKVEIEGVTLAGLDDGIEERARFDFYEAGKVSRSLVAVLHEPDLVKNQPEHVSLQVSGHSHGGQICLPFGQIVHLPRQGRRYWRGFYPKAPVPLYVSRGIGTTGPDYRLFCPPEAVVLRLRAA